MRNVADLPLHGGHVPQWLARRMGKLTRLVLKLAVEEYGTRGLLERLSDPVWFQAFNNVIGMDWDSSGSTTVTAGMIKEALWKEELGVKVAGGGKGGKKSRATPEELKRIASLYDLDPEPYVRTSRLVAKVDTVALQTGYQLYHHVFLLDEEGNWAVIQQGMNKRERMASASTGSTAKPSPSTPPIRPSPVWRRSSHLTPSQGRRRSTRRRSSTLFRRVP